MRACRDGRLSRGWLPGPGDSRGTAGGQEQAEIEPSRRRAFLSVRFAGLCRVLVSGTLRALRLPFYGTGPGKCVCLAPSFFLRLVFGPAPGFRFFSGGLFCDGRSRGLSGGVRSSELALVFRCFWHFAGIFSVWRVRKSTREGRFRVVP